MLSWVELVRDSVQKRCMLGNRRAKGRMCQLLWGHLFKVISTERPNKDKTRHGDKRTLTTAVLQEGEYIVYTWFGNENN